VPNIIDFTVDSRFLDRPRLYPRQALLLKLMFLEEELLTEYDHEVLRLWGEGGPHGLETGTQYGVASDVLTRIRLLRATGRRWFREAVLVLGRRGSKGYLGAISVAYLLWLFLEAEDVAERFGIAKGKSVTVQIYAINKDEARDVFFRDLVNIITTAPCFRPYLAEVRADRLTILSRAQVAAGSLAAGEAPAFVIAARESTEAGARGPAAVLQVHDEAAHAVAVGSARSIDEIYGASSPAQLEFGLDAFTLLPSSPRHKQGVFYELYELGLALDEEGKPLHPEILAVQLPSWDLYLDWERADTIPLYPGGEMFGRLSGPIIDPNDPFLQRLRKTRPDEFRVEYEAKWAEVLLQWLNAGMVSRMFAPWKERTLTPQYSRQPGAHFYVGHVDLGYVGDSAGLVIVHDEPGEDPYRPHAVVDLIEVWKPSEYDQHQVHLPSIEAVLKVHLPNFLLDRLTFDSFQSVTIVQNLRDYAHELGLHCQIEVVQNTQARNRYVAEEFKATLYDGRVHAPYNQLAQDELLFLQDIGPRVDHPSTGPVTTNDTSVCLFEAVAGLFEMSRAPGTRLGALGLRGSRWPHSEAEIHAGLSGFRSSRAPEYRRLQGGTTTSMPRRPSWFRV
jgi:hypothetical protein